jgi:membrane peptidoglycan carboxypeptidase
MARSSSGASPQVPDPADAPEPVSRPAPRAPRTRRVTPVGAVGRFAAFLGASVLAGALVAGIALPFAGALGLTAKAATENFDNLPDDLEQPKLAQASYIYDAKGGPIATVYSRYRIIVPSDQIAPVMGKALVAIEDSRFYEHGPIDMKGTLRALVNNQSGGDVQGGSSLTQQYVKNIFIEQAGADMKKVAAAQERSVSRKIKELKFAIGVEQKLTKDEILTNYLNINFFGQQAYGVEAASQRYFSKHAKDLTLPEAATLAGLVQAPSLYDPVVNPNTSTLRRNVVLQRMLETGAATADEVAKAKAAPLGVKVQPVPNGCITADARHGSAFFCDYVERVVKSDEAFGKTPEERATLWLNGGLKITTTLDPQAQDAAYTAATNGVRQTDPVADAVAMVEPGTGKIKAMAQSRPYGFGDNETVINYNVDKSMGGSTYGFQTGSTFKPFTAAAALENRVEVSQTYSTGSQIDLRKEKFSTCGKHVMGDKFQNEMESETGTWNMQTALEKSINTYFILLEKQVGICPVTQMAEAMGVHRGDGKPLEQFASLTLGANEVAPLTMAAAYATFANRGEYCTPVAITDVTRLDGTKLKVPEGSCRRVMSKGTADTINEMLTGVVEDGTGAMAGLTDRENAGKTGTTEYRKAAWFVGYTPNLSTAVWVGGPKDGVKMYDITIAGKYHEMVYGGQVPGPIWKAAMKGALKGQAAPGFSAPPDGAIPSKPDPRQSSKPPRDTKRPGRD